MRARDGEGYAPFLCINLQTCIHSVWCFRFVAKNEKKNGSERLSHEKRGEPYFVDIFKETWYLSYCGCFRE